MSAAGRVQRVDGPSPAVVVLTVYSPERGKRVLLFDASADRLRWVPERAKGNPADGFVRRLRKLLVGAHIDRIEHKGSRVRVGLQLRNRFAWLLAHRGVPVVREHDGRPLAGRARFAQLELDEEGWLPLEPEVADATPVSSDEDRERRELRSRIRAHLRKLRRKAKAIAQDAARAERAPALRHEAELITAHLHRWNGEPELEVDDWNTGETRAVAIDPRLGAQAQADALFRTAKRFERGAKIARARLAEVEDAIADVVALRDALEGSEIDLARERVVALGIARRQAPPGRKREQARRPHRTFFSGQQRILVGKGPSDNDALTLDARPHHHWLHARGVGGAHVIVPLNKNATIGSETLIDAATLAAHFSKSRGEDRVEVQHTERRHVRKPRGFPPGAVRVAREKVIVVRLEPARLKRLLATERPGS